MKYGRGEGRAYVRGALRGYITALYTPYDGGGEIDFAKLRTNVERTLALPGVGGLSVNTLHQEFWTFTPDERRRLVETVIETVAGRAPVVVGCTDPSARVAAGYARHAEASGADLVMVWPPFYGPRTPPGVRAFYEEVAAAVDIGMVVYSTTLSELGYYLTPDQVAGLLHIPNVCAVQNTTLDIAQYAAMLRAVGAEIAVATSLEEYFHFGRTVFADRAANFMIGSSRPIFCQSAARPHCGDFVAAMEAGDLAAAATHLRHIMAIAADLQSRYFAQGFHHVALFKALAGILGMETGGVRPPLAPPDRDALAGCLAVLVAEGLADPAATPPAWAKG